MRFIAVTAISGLATTMLATPALGTESRDAAVASDLIEHTLACYANYAATGPLTGEVEISVSIGADGRATSVTTPAGTPDRMAAAAQCVGVRLDYRPALQDGQPVAAKLNMTVQFPSLPEVRNELQRVVDYCHAPWTEAKITLATRVRDAAGLPVRNQQAPMDARIAAADSSAYEGSVDLTARVGTDGKIKEYQLPGGVLPWMQEAVKCVVDRLEFFPARLRTEAAESWTLLSLVFGLSDEQHLAAEITPPSPRSSEETILAAYRKCYPADETLTAKIAYRITVAKTGRVRKAELLESSGNAALDQAGVCILRNLSFAPARRNGINVESTLNWPILVRPAD